MCTYRQKHHLQWRSISEPQKVFVELNGNARQLARTSILKLKVIKHLAATSIYNAVDGHPSPLVSC